jgi:hypothetical protein
VISLIQEAFSIDVHSLKLSETGTARFLYLKEYVFSKYADPLPGEAHVDEKERIRLAIEKWQKAEQRNAVTNCRLGSGDVVTFRTRMRGKPGTRMKFSSSDVLNIARDIVTSVLGVRLPHANVLHGAFTNGASTRIKRSESSVAEKFEGRPHATAQASLFYPWLAFANPGWERLNPEGFTPEVVNGSMMFTVPKNSEIERVACKEPEANSYLQRAYGLYIRKQLKKHGIDLTDQSRNQELSRVAYRRGLATIDLSAASDSISRELVKQLLPQEWFDALNSVRSHSVLTPSNGAVSHHLEMFSSMGNGFTFELESLLFWALTRAVSRLIRAKGTISVYGDDIICPLATGRILPRVFAFFGFKVNTLKSCTRGAYRESCGAHWYYGVDVKPFFVRGKPKTVVDIIQISNQLMAWMTRESDLADIPLSLISLWGQLSTMIDERLYGGQSFERSDALVTGHMPRELLRRKLKKKMRPQLGAYLAWHHSKLQARHDVLGEFIDPSRGHSLIMRSWIDYVRSAAKNGANNAVSPPDSASEVLVEKDWVQRPNRTWYDRDVMWLAQQVIIFGLEKHKKLSEQTLGNPV